jgi:peptide/nickel transport system substrate-binding protein
VRQQPPKRGGTLRFATRADATGLDPHRNLMYLVSTCLAATTMGLLDLNLQSEPIPGIASAWEASPDLMTYTFTLRPGVLFHNGREVDAAAVEWNLARMRDPQTSHPLTRSALQRLQDVEVVDKYTVRCRLHEPSAAFPANVVYYPCALIAPDSAEQADVHPIGCGPFKLVKWDRNNVTELTRFEHYFETDAEGRSLPYLDGIVGKVKKEDRGRLTSLRAGEVDLIDSMAYVDAAAFVQKYADTYQTWDVPLLGTSYLLFNLDRGPFADKRLRHAAAHAIEREAIQQVVFSGRGNIATSFYGPASPWHASGVKPYPAYDPDKAKFLLQQAQAMGTEVILQTQEAYPYTQQTADLLQAMWSEVGFKVKIHTYSAPVLRQKRRDREFHAESTAASYRFDPDGWFSQQFLSTAPSAKQNAGFRHERVDSLIAMARRTADKQRRLELYNDIESIVNEELPLLYLHHITLMEAGTMQVHGYQPSLSGAFSTRGAGIRTTWLA